MSLQYVCSVRFCSAAEECNEEPDGLQGQLNRTSCQTPSVCCSKFTLLFVCFILTYVALSYYGACSVTLGMYSSAFYLDIKHLQFTHCMYGGVECLKNSALIRSSINAIEDAVAICKLTEGCAHDANTPLIRPVPD